MTLDINPQKDTATKQFAKTLLLLQFGLFTSVGLITMILMNVVVFGDSITPRNNNTLPQSTQTK